MNNLLVQIAISNDRIGVLNSNGEINCKEGSIGSGWVNVTQNKGGNLPKMKKIAMSGKRILALTETGQVYGTSPDNFPTWNGVWTGLLTDNTIDIAVTADRILVLKTDGQVWAKEGGWGEGWTIL